MTFFPARAAHIFTSVLSAALLTACASASPETDGAAPQFSHVLTGSASEQRPPWIDVVPETTGGMEIFVGLSDYFASEKEARDDALRHAITRYAEYTGVDVSVFNETLRQLQGNESDVLTAQVARDSNTTLETGASVSRIKPRSWYWEKYLAKSGRQSVGTSWRYWVEVTVPVDELERVQAARQQQEEERKRQTRQAYERGSSEISSLVDAASAIQQEARQAAGSGDILTALSLLHDEKTRLVEARERYGAVGGRIGSEASRLSQPIGELSDLQEKLQNSVFIDVGRFNSYCLMPHPGAREINVWVWCKLDGQTYPLKNLPLLLEGDQSDSRFPARTNNRGKATFHLAGAEDSVLQVRIDDSLIRLDPIQAKGLCSAANRLYLNRAPESLDQLIRQGIQDLFQGPSVAPLPTESLMLGSVTYKEATGGGEFAILVKDVLGQSLTSVDGLKVISPRKHSARELTRTMRDQGISMESRGVGDGAIQAHINQADAALKANYRLYGDELQLTLALQRARTGQLVKKTTVSIPRRSIPPGIALVPPASQSSSSPSHLESGTIRLDIASHLGDGQTYEEGDTISYFVSTDRDAYLILIYQDAAGNLIQILPNRYSGNELFRAGNYIEVPRPTDSFEFVIQPPFGIEHVWAFASDRPFPALQGEDIGNGLALLSGELTDIASTLRKTGSRPGGTYGEARATITTVARR